jgi:WXG100 family type VII secretion target
MPDMNVTYDDMHNAASSLSQGEENIIQMLNKLKSDIDQLVSSGYVTDKSSKAFQESYQEFNSGVTRTVSGLTGMSQYLTKAAQALQQTDTDLANSLNN